MILHPGILGLLLLSAVTCGLTVYAAWHGAVIARRWDLKSGTEGQLELERRTYLVSTVLLYVFGFQVLSPFLFAFTADGLCPLLPGAMCAAGTLGANGFGYPTLFLKLAVFLVAGVWLVLNHADNRAPDYPLTRAKYVLLLTAAPLVVAEAVSQAAFFLGLDPEIITSCCGTLFSAQGATLGSDLAAAPVRPAQIAFFGVLGATVLAGAASLRTSRGRGLFAALCGASLAVGLAGVVSFVSIYVYELPTHHCPFCLLQAEYGAVGYPLYAGLLGAGVTGIAVGVLAPFRRHPTLAEVIPALQNRLTAAATLLLAGVIGLAAWAVGASDFRP